MKRATPVLLLVAAVAWWMLSVRPAWRAVTSVRHGRDYATYYYAVIEAVAPERPGRGDPYDTAALGRRARAEGTRRSVHPYFYPPPFLLSMLWVTPPGRAPLSLATGYRAWFWMNQGMLLAVLWALHRWFRAHPLVLAGLALSLSALPDNARMGQANLLVLWLSVVGLWRGSGVALGAAAMAKMSPALYLVAWVAERRWKPVLAAIGTAVALSLLALPLVPLQTQIRFYTEILPGFSSGNYHGLTVPITLPANHSIPDLFNQLWPGPDDHTLSDRARIASQAVSLSLLGVLAWGAATRRRAMAADPLVAANLYGALSVLMLITPVYTYEHHLVVMLLPLAALAQAFVERRLSRRWLLLALPAGFLVCWPLRWLRSAQELWPAASWVLQESRFFGLVWVGGLCFTAAMVRKNSK
ncbi:MAG: DUF2029 domain-containing protein [Deltaproteobacteria bacterium]|nr:MAG: DUF2029 domain-containing protein [Deltaproteobacteria bacterium]